jgi:hypothetical protein
MYWILDQYWIQQKLFHTLLNWKTSQEQQHLSLFNIEPVIYMYNTLGKPQIKFSTKIVQTLEEQNKNPPTLRSKMHTSIKRKNRWKAGKRIATQWAEWATGKAQDGRLSFLSQSVSEAAPICNRIPRRLRQKIMAGVLSTSNNHKTCSSAY